MKRIKYYEQFNEERHDNLILSVNYDELRKIQFAIELYTEGVEQDINEYEWMQNEHEKKVLAFLKAMCFDIDMIATDELEHKCRVNELPIY